MFKPMHVMWKDYIRLLLKSTEKNQFLLGVDLHGAIILVVESKLTYYVGIGGIMIRETGKAFGIVTEENKFRVDCWKVTLHRDNLNSRKIGL
ncbi:ribonuclease MRP protein subunit POP4-like isoform X2 [Cicer arietinum]|uniref:ribonuclease MRP protein subunit POP4-like isoform X2 n=1 Tax=Cicer arietinum TaxID=3827 RepID=UPI003CC65BDC